jgi:hypothetical protein
MRVVMSTVICICSSEREPSVWADNPQRMQGLLCTLTESAVLIASLRTIITLVVESVSARI